MTLGRFLNFILAKFIAFILIGILSSCTKPNELEAVVPEASGSVAAPSGSPVVTQVNSSTTDGAYKAGDVISVRVTFGLAATVTGTPRVLLETGNTDRYATYVSGSGGVTLVFTYTVQAGDTSDDLSYVNINSLELNGGTISAPDATAMNLVLPGLGASGSLSINRALVIDTTAPVAAGAVTDGTYFNSTTSSPTLTWAAATDTSGSGIAKYQVAIGTTSGGTQTLNWTDIGNVTTYQVTSGITLTAGSAYYASIRAVDLAGNISNVINSDGWIVDVTAPTSPATVYDGVSSYSTSESPPITWTASTDTGGSGLSGYELAIGTTAGGTDVLNWTSVGTVTSYVRTGLTLSAGTTYYASVRAVDIAGNLTAAQGDGWQVLACDTYGWCPQAYLKAPNSQPGDAFGSSVAASGDTIIVGAFLEDSNQTTITNGSTASSDNSATAAGAAYIFKRAGTTWVQEAYLKAPNADSTDSFGESVAISGDTAVVGAPNEASLQATITNGTTASAMNVGVAGAVYVFKRTGTTWAQEAYIKPPNITLGVDFGAYVAIDGDTIVAGSLAEKSNQTTITNGTTASSNISMSYSGAAYIFKRAGTLWAQEAYIKPPNTDSFDSFGVSVDISGDTVAVGAFAESSNQTTITNGITASSDNSASSAGAVYVFKRNGTTWAQEAYIKTPNMEAGDQFGRGVAISGDTIVAGASNEDSNQTTITNGITASSDNSASNAGAAYVFKRTGTTWVQEAYLKAPNAETSDQFGSSVFIDGDTIAVTAVDNSSQGTITNGVTASSDNSATGAGAVYVFKRTGFNWVQEAYVKAPNARTSDEFGVSPYWGSTIHLSGNTLVVGAAGEDSNQTTITNGVTASSDGSSSGAGAAYVFTVNRQATWQQQAYAKAPNAEANDNFGEVVAIDQDTLVVGARKEDSNQTTITNGTTASADNSRTDSGAAYVFKRSGTTWVQEAYLKAVNADASDEFGRSVAISGDTIVVGAPYEASNQTTITNGTTASVDNTYSYAGAAYVFKRTGTTWAQEAYLKPPNNYYGVYFGTAVSIHRDTIIVSGPYEDSNQTTITNGTTASADQSMSGAGAVYIFKRTGVNWAQEAYVKAPNANASDNFGTSVGIFGDTAAVGAMWEDSNQTTITNGATASADNSSVDSGAIYVFKRTGVNWAQQAYIKPANTHDADRFGNALSIYEDTIAAGVELESSNQTTITNGSTASSDTSAGWSGAVYVYKRTGTSWAQEAYIKASDAMGSDRFGCSVSIYGDTIVAGAYGEDSNQTTITNGSSASSDTSVAQAGAAYIFKRTGVTWTQEAYLKPPNPQLADYFGNSVSISSDTVVVGAQNEDSNQTTITNGTTASSDNSASNSGAVYIFQR